MNKPIQSDFSSPSKSLILMLVLYITFFKIKVSKENIKIKGLSHFLKITNQKQLKMEIKIISVKIFFYIIYGIKDFLEL